MRKSLGASKAQSVERLSEKSALMKMAWSRRGETMRAELSALPGRLGAFGGALEPLRDPEAGCGHRSAATGPQAYACKSFTAKAARSAQAAAEEAHGLWGSAVKASAAAAGGFSEIKALCGAGLATRAKLAPLGKSLPSGWRETYAEACPDALALAKGRLESRETVETAAKAQRKRYDAGYRRLAAVQKAADAALDASTKVPKAPSGKASSKAATIPLPVDGKKLAGLEESAAKLKAQAEALWKLVVKRLNDGGAEEEELLALGEALIQ
jgi:hypothetical protein